jgi:hypothetical protein
MEQLDQLFTEVPTAWFSFNSDTIGIMAYQVRISSVSTHARLSSSVSLFTVTVGLTQYARLLQH